MKKTFYLIFTAALCLISCTKENIGTGNADGDGNAVVRICATIDPAIETDGKTTLLDVDGDRAIKWAKDDEIGIYGSNNTQNITAYLDDDYIGTVSGQFLVGGAYTNPQFAYYPYSKDVIYNGTILDVINLPSVQKMVEGKIFDGIVCPMFAKYDAASSSFKFKNICSVFEVQLTGTDKITEVQLRSLDKALAGKGSVTVADEGPVFVLGTDDTSMSVTLQLANPVQLSSTPTPFYFVVAPGTYSSLSVYVKTEGGEAYQKASAASHTVQARHILPFKSMEIGKPDASSATDLTADGKYSNTFLISPDATGLYCFDAKNVDGTAIEGAFADCLWESEGCLTGDYYYDKTAGKIYFRKVRPNSGTALICLFNEKQIVVWSWTIWMSEVKDQTWGADGSRYTFMDRNLGATWAPSSSSDVSGSTAEQITLSSGFLYQYGRPTPLPGAKSLNTTKRYEGEGVTSGYTTRDGKSVNKDVLKTDTWQPVFHKYYPEYSYGWEPRNKLWSLSEALSYPLSMNNIWANMTTTNQWGGCWAKEVNVTGANALWNVEKTNYDPCPYGYRVPQLTEMRNFIDDGNGALALTNGQTKEYLGGYITRESNFLWIPKAGFRTYGGGDDSTNGYSYTIAYWGNHVHTSGNRWYVGNAAFWTYNPTDTQATLTGCVGWGLSWKTPATGDVHARFLHMGHQNMMEETKDSKPVVGVIGEAMSIRCVKIQ